MAAEQRNPFFDLAGKAALVVGGGRGIGYAVSERFIDAGARVCIVSQNTDSLAEGLAKLKRSERAADGVAAEITDPAAVASAYEQAKALVGDIDILIVTAGIVGPSAPVWRYDLEIFDRVVAVNLNGTAHWLRAVLPDMCERGRGSIVTFASVAGKEGNPNQSAYCAAKAAVMALTKSVAKEVVGRGVRVNCVAPGIVATEMSLAVPDETRNYILAKVPMGRMGHPAEIAAVVHLLASDEAGFTTGQIYDASGGRATY
jgi:3-oxoacyl-[acyl-carrier protein] reductase